eukprot:4812460-Prorocentrum_lima.AAC.1
MEGLSEHEAGAAIPTVAESWTPTAEFWRSQLHNDQYQRAALAQSYQLEYWQPVPGVPRFD